MWIEWHPAALKEFAKLDTASQRRIAKVLSDLAGLDDAGSRLLPYRGELKGCWKLRVGDFRLVCDMSEETPPRLTILLVGHRASVYATRSQEAARRRKTDR